MSRAICRASLVYFRASSYFSVVQIKQPQVHQVLHQAILVADLAAQPQSLPDSWPARPWICPCLLHLGHLSQATGDAALVADLPPDLQRLVESCAARLPACSAAGTRLPGPAELTPSAPDCRTESPGCSALFSGSSAACGSSLLMSTRPLANSALTLFGSDASNLARYFLASTIVVADSSYNFASANSASVSSGLTLTSSS